jgi:hypothetical protein
MEESGRTWTSLEARVGIDSPPNRTRNPLICSECLALTIPDSTRFALSHCTAPAQQLGAFAAVTVCPLNLVVSVLGSHVEGSPRDASPRRYMLG